MPVPLEPGRTVACKGYVTRLISVINKPAGELERCLGYNRGRLEAGWALLLLKQPISGTDFRFAGYTYFSDGRIGDPRLGKARTDVHDDLQGLLANPAEFSRKFAAERFPLTGVERIVRIIPISAPDPAIAAPDLYPVGTGVPQWILTVEKRFLVATVVRPGVPAVGGGGHLPRGFWIDPARARTL